MPNEPIIIADTLFAHQRTIIKDPARFKIVVAGRRFGKTMLAAYATLKAALVCITNRKQAIEGDCHDSKQSEQHPDSNTKATTITDTAVKGERLVSIINNGLEGNPHEEEDNFDRQYIDKLITDKRYLQRQFNKPCLCWWVAPVYSQSDIAFRMLKRIIPQQLLAKPPSNNPKRIELKGGAIIEFKTAVEPDNLRGEGLDFLVMDEAAAMPPFLWEETLRPALSDTQGAALFISTPRGHNWFHGLYQRGLDPAFPEYVSFHHPTSDNPLITSAELDEARRSLSDKAFRQEYLAEFTANDALVFDYVNDIIGGNLSEPSANRRYFAGIDLARYHDYTVIVIIDDSGQVVSFSRLHNIPFRLQKLRIIELLRRYRAYAMIDVTGMGEAFYEQLAREVSVKAFRFTQQSKATLVEDLAIVIERGQIRIPAELAVLIDELKSFSYDVTANGHIRYGGIHGTHDDAVMALGLALQAKNSIGVISYTSYAKRRNLGYGRGIY